MKRSILCLLACLVITSQQAAYAVDLGIEGQVFEPIEEDFRIMIMRMLAKQDLGGAVDDLKESAESYTKNLTNYFYPRATKTETRWKDVGIITTEDIYFPGIDWQTGSVFEAQPVLAVKAGTYLNVLDKLMPGSIPRLFIFDATDEAQLALAKTLMAAKIDNLKFMITAGDLGPLSKEMNIPVFHANQPDMDRFNVKALPTLLGFGIGKHKGHMAITEFKLPTDRDVVQKAWFGLPYPGYDPESELKIEKAQDSTLEKSKN